MPEHSPRINALPSELLSFILIATYNSYAASADYAFSPLTRYPILLSSTCSHWRNVAVETQPIWTTVDIKSIDQARMYFQRSGTMLLRVRLAGKAYADSEEETPRTAPSDEMREFIFSYAPRFQALVVNLSDLGDETAVFTELLPHLVENTCQELALFKDYRSSQIAGPFIHEELDRLFKPLRFLHLESFEIHPNTITCRNLTELYLSYPEGDLSSAIIGQLLRSNPGLSSVTLFGFRSVVLSPDNTEPIHLPELRHLRIDGYAERIIPWFFSVLTPGSHDIYLHLDSISPLYNRPDVLMKSLAQFFQRATVTSLHLEITELNIPFLLRFLPSLGYLRLTSYFFDSYPGLLNNIDKVTESLTKLQAIDLYKCQLEDYRSLDEGLQTLLKTPSLGALRYFRCGRNPEDQPKLRTLLSGSTAAQVTESPEVELEARPHLFR